MASVYKLYDEAALVVRCREVCIKFKLYKKFIYLKKNFEAWNKKLGALLIIDINKKNLTLASNRNKIKIEVKLKIETKISYF